MIGLFGIVPITFQHATGIASCPILAFLPACYVVTLGYTLAGVSMRVGARFRTPLFLIAWMPAFGLALIGSSMQVLGNEACPRSVADIPGCYLSLTLTSSLFIAFIVERLYRPKAA